MKKNNKAKKEEIKNFIKKGLEAILINVNPKMDKKLFKKNIKKAGKVLSKGASKIKNSKHPIEVIKLHPKEKN